ncbi:MAG: hypothetical protein P8L34_08855 [Arenicellales bacterium]|jgi:hypothetical protein|nr:hypothetical protein [Arenicellales bacterium]
MESIFYDFWMQLSLTPSLFKAVNAKHWAKTALADQDAFTVRATILLF